MKPITCQDPVCTGGDMCGACISRNIVSKEGYLLIEAIERCPASEQQTDAVSTALSFIKKVEPMVYGNLNRKQRVKEPGVYSWPPVEGRLTSIYPGDILQRSSPGVFTKLSDLCKVGILIPEESVEDIPVNGTHPEVGFFESSFQGFIAGKGGDGGAWTLQQAKTIFECGGYSVFCVSIVKMKVERVYSIAEAEAFFK